MGWKILLEAVRFILKKYEPVASHGDPFRVIFYDFTNVLIKNGCVGRPNGLENTPRGYTIHSGQVWARGEPWRPCS